MATRNTGVLIDENEIPDTINSGKELFTAHFENGHWDIRTWDDHLIGVVTNGKFEFQPHIVGFYVTPIDMADLMWLHLECSIVDGRRERAAHTQLPPTGQ